MSPSPKRQRQRERQQQARAQAAVEEKKQQQKRTWLGIGGIVALVVVLALAFSIFGGGNDSKSDDEGAATSTTTAGTDNDTDDVECPPEDGASEPRLNFPSSPPNCLEDGANYEAVFDTTAGEIRVALNSDDTPGTVNNFVFLARYGYYDGTEIFRSDPSIDILQGGAPHTNSASDPGPGYTIADEGSDWTYEPGDLVMARTAAPDSAGAQFFFSTGDNTANLNSQGTYVVFGKTTAGLDVLEAIMDTHEDDPSSGLGGHPNPVPVINKVTIVQN
ncbi:MAG: peptidylprolyl isomerase [Acidimicrobiia bacterium]